MELAANEPNPTTRLSCSSRTNKQEHFVPQVILLFCHTVQRSENQTEAVKQLLFLN